MTDEPENRRGEGEKPDEEAAEEAEQERPTVAPPFDPIAFAKEVLGSPEGAQGGGQAGQGAAPPAAPGAAAPGGKKTPMGLPRAAMPTLSDPAELEDARLRSVGSGPPAPAPRKTPQGVLSLADMQAPSVPPAMLKAPPMPRKQSTDSFAAVDREWEELATSPPPPMQQALIDSLAEPPSAAPPTRDAPSKVAEKVEEEKKTAAAAAAAPEAQAEAEAEDALPAPSEPEPLRQTPLDDDAPEIETLPSEQEMHDRVSLGDYTGALDIAEKLLLLDPENDEAQECAENCRGVLKQMYTARIGALDRVPMVMVPRDQLRWLTIDHRAGFVLSLIDGVSSMEMILDVSGMPELDALRILSELVQQRIISFR